jgi:prophage tail gpP-like protein
MSSQVIVLAEPSGGGGFQKLVWRKIKIRKSLDEICHSMELEVPASERNKIHKHDKVEVRCYNQYISESEKNGQKRRVTTVMVDEITDVTDTNRKGLLIVGRSPARDVIDSAWGDMVLQQQNLEKIANDIVSPFLDAVGIEEFEFKGRPHVTRMPTDGPETDPVFSFSWDYESPWQKLVAEADNQGYIFTSNEAGNLYLWKVAEERRSEGFSLSERINIRDIQTTENGAEQFHEYVVSGAGKEARQTDLTCKNKRKMFIKLTDLVVSEENLRRRAMTEMLRRRENRTTVTVSGWGLSDSQIKALGDTYQKEIFWNPNFLIPVNIPSSGLNGNLLISQVEYQADESSTTAALTLVNPEAYK